MMYRIKRFIRDNESLLMLLSMIYRLFGFNYIKGRNGLKIRVTGVFSRKVKIINHGNNNVVAVGKGILQGILICCRKVISKNLVISMNQKIGGAK